MALVLLTKALDPLYRLKSEVQRVTLDMMNALRLLRNHVRPVYLFSETKMGEIGCG